MTKVESSTRSVRLKVPAKPEYIVLTRLALSAVCRLTSLEPEDVADLKLAVTEAATAFVGEQSEDELSCSSEFSPTKAVAASVTASLRSATSSGSSDVSLHTAESASRVRTMYSGFAGTFRRTLRVLLSTWVIGSPFPVRPQG